jgi:hypothetical protein
LNKVISKETVRFLKNLEYVVNKDKQIPEGKYLSSVQSEPQSNALVQSEAE